jgi:hypothetical protein
MKVFFDTNVYVAEAILGQAAERLIEATDRAAIDPHRGARIATHCSQRSERQPYLGWRLGGWNRLLGHQRQTPFGVESLRGTADCVHGPVLSDPSRHRPTCVRRQTPAIFRKSAAIALSRAACAALVATRSAAEPGGS